MALRTTLVDIVMAALRAGHNAKFSVSDQVWQSQTPAEGRTNQNLTTLCLRTS
jgi:hypothetical protein